MRMETMYCWKSCAISSTTVKTVERCVPMNGECDCECEHCDHHEEEEAVNLYIMKVVESEEDGEEIEEFLPWKTKTCSRNLSKWFKRILKLTKNWTTSNTTVWVVSCT